MEGLKVPNLLVQPNSHSMGLQNFLLHVGEEKIQRIEQFAFGTTCFSQAGTCSELFSGVYYNLTCSATTGSEWQQLQLIQCQPS